MTKRNWKYPTLDYYGVTAIPFPTTEGRKRIKEVYRNELKNTKRLGFRTRKEAQRVYDLIPADARSLFEVITHGYV